MPRKDLKNYTSREVILMFSDTTGGKTYSVVKLLEQLEAEGKTMLVIDKDNRFADMVHALIHRIPDNLIYYTVESWEDVEDAVDEAVDLLGPGDWCVAEMMGSMWDFAQSEFTRQVHGEDFADYILHARIEAQKEADKVSGKDADKAVQRGMQYNAMSGRLDWPAIKHMHNTKFRDRLIGQASCNLLFTTEANALSDDEKSNGRFKNFHGLGYRPDGEKENQFRVDTIMFLQRKNGAFVWRTDMNAGNGKEKPTRRLVKDMDCTGQGALTHYLDMVGSGKLALDAEDDEDI